MKCKKERFHCDNQHEVMKNCHVMTAYAGVHKKVNRAPSYLVCFTKESYDIAIGVEGEKTFGNKK